MQIKQHEAVGTGEAVCRPDNVIPSGVAKSAASEFREIISQSG